MQNKPPVGERDIPLFLLRLAKLQPPEDRQAFTAVPQRPVPSRGREPQSPPPRFPPVRPTRQRPTHRSRGPLSARLSPRGCPSPAATAPLTGRAEEAPGAGRCRSDPAAEGNCPSPSSPRLPPGQPPAPQSPAPRRTPGAAGGGGIAAALTGTPRCRALWAMYSSRRATLLRAAPAAPFRLPSRSDTRARSGPALSSALPLTCTSRPDGAGGSPRPAGAGAGAGVEAGRSSAKRRAGGGAGSAMAAGPSRHHGNPRQRTRCTLGGAHVTHSLPLPITTPRPRGRQTEAPPRHDRYRGGSSSVLPPKGVRHDSYRGREPLAVGQRG